jgi:hypothetical protein
MSVRHNFVSAEENSLPIMNVLMKHCYRVQMKPCERCIVNG